jgi:hypothetical protein
MAVAELNLSRREVLAATLAVPVVRVASRRGRGDEGERQKAQSQKAQSFVVTKSDRASSSPDRPGPGRRTAAWDRALARFRHAEVALAAATAAHADDDLFDRVLGRFNIALRRLLRAPAPDLAGLALKLELAARESAWELTGAETCIAALAREARRLART